jgi:hypothetical protein
LAERAPSTNRTNRLEEILKVHGRGAGIFK